MMEEGWLLERVMSHDSRISRAFLLRFVTPLEHPSIAFEYDEAARVNVIAGQALPAVCGGLDVKTLGVAAED